jgi:hypothetical protein
LDKRCWDVLGVDVKWWETCFWLVTHCQVGKEAFHRVSFFYGRLPQEDEAFVQLGRW